MENYNSSLLISGAIIVASIIISFTINNNSSSNDHCYNKVYKAELKRQETVLYLKKDRLTMESRAAQNAKILCLHK
jgi:hypothetical protein